jgi:hypothetical protein
MSSSNLANAAQVEDEAEEEVREEYAPGTRFPFIASKKHTFIASATQVFWNLVGWASLAQLVTRSRSNDHCLSQFCISKFVFAHPHET